MHPVVGHPIDGLWGLANVTSSGGVTHQVAEDAIPAFCEERICLARMSEAVEGDDRFASEDVRTLEVRYGVNGERASQLSGDRQ